MGGYPLESEGWNFLTSKNKIFHCLSLLKKKKSSFRARKESTNGRSLSSQLKEFSVTTGA